MFCAKDLMSYALYNLEILCIAAIFNRLAFSIFNEIMIRMSWSEIVSQLLAHLPLVLEFPVSIPAFDEFRCSNMLSLVSFAGITQNKCAIL